MSAITVTINGNTVTGSQEEVVALLLAASPAKVTPTPKESAPKKSRKQAKTDRMTLTEAKAAGLVPWGMTKREAREAGVWRADVTGYVREQIKARKA